MTEHCCGMPATCEKQCTTIGDCTTPKLCLSVGTCKGAHVMPASVRASADLLSEAQQPAAGADASNATAGQALEVVAWIRGSGLEMLRSGDGMATVYRSEGMSNYSVPLVRQSDAAARIAALEAENARLRQDAERYRWLRDRAGRDGGIGLLCVVVDGYHVECASMAYVGERPTGNELDAAIDADRAQG